jgi:capsular exopolysaccharide synthesis family protein
MQKIEQERPFYAVPVREADPPQRGNHPTPSKYRRWAHEEALRLVQQLFSFQAQEGPKVVVFAGIDHGSGCSQICVSVAETLSSSAQRPVCLLEANFRSPALANIFETTHHRGLTNALRVEGPVDSFAEPLSHEHLWLISSGNLTGDSADLLTTERFRETITELRKTFDFVIVDAPPLSLYADAISVGQLADGLVLVLEAGASRREAATDVAAKLRSLNIPILAAVLNKREFPIPEPIYRRL